MRPETPRGRRTAIVAIAGALTLVALATLRPEPPIAANRSLCFWCGERALADAILNIVLFLPLGAALALAGARPARAVFAAGAISAGIELAQLAMAGRIASLGDVTTNTAGAALGAWLALRSWQTPAPHQRRIMTAGAALLAVAVPLATAVMLQSDLPPTTWYGQWATRFTGFGWFRGRILGVTLGPLALPDGGLADVASARRLLARGARLEVGGVAAEFPGRLAPLFSIGDLAGRTIVLLGVEGRDLVYRRRLRATRFGLDQPDLRARDALIGIQPGDPLRVAVWQESGGWCLGAALPACGMRFGLGRGWSLLVRGRPAAARFTPILDATWLAALFLPLGYLAAGWFGAAMAGAALAVLALLPALAPGMQVTSADAAGSALGLLLGRLAHVLSLRAGTRPV